jgi:predicted cupin superfamily sugar epimerase
MSRPALAETLDLAPHPEGGWFRQTWVSPETVSLSDGRVRPTATLIYFLLPAGESSSWHRVASDEIWLAHAGAVVLEYGGSGDAPVAERTARLAVDGDAQVLVPAGVWQRTVPGEADALVSCLVSPGFYFAYFELWAPPAGRGGPPRPSQPAHGGHRVGP